MIQLAGFIPDEDIKIKYIGTRPGEKIVEQLMTAEEYLEKTENSRIFKVSRHSGNMDLYELSALRSAVETNDTKKALAILKRFAPNIKEGKD